MNEFWVGMKSGHKVVIVSIIVGVPVLVWKIDEFERGMSWIIELAKVLVQQVVGAAT